ncbi:hypothetical protein FD12_GL001384 [Lentilactobacillus rapi DSM 19907 = JCM 15042]|uniref:Uncharacterized protein n=2 Tax=Lentilactobacillus rapi TaxID=481723 RepID=A0A512PLH7_9LACO|nr:Gp138 family membrane-puncturing spike protein [Lentilactobacillus rapi]KRL17855.1 hypothetical protein FD12_GL001384 [Lentilactobacillus rapi DSM 19907 = JCM 15042]GEP72040.1 hypothetical protein LRA02_09080 [Lentilactobacillus rapi]
MSQTIEDTFHELMSKVQNKTKYETNVGEFAKIVRYNKGSHTADVQPLVDDVGGRDEARIINECPVLYPCYAVDELRAEIISKGQDAMKTISPRPTIKPGATVFIVFNNRDLDNFTGGSFQKSSDRMHDINDAVVVGVLE